MPEYSFWFIQYVMGETRYCIATKWDIFWRVIYLVGCKILQKTNTSYTQDTHTNRCVLGGKK